MQEFATKLYNNLISELEEIRLTGIDEFNTNEACFNAIQLALTHLKEKVIHSTFNTDVEEIAFFKIMKPQFVSLLLYYTALLKMHLALPEGSIKTKRKSVLKGIERCKKHYLKNKSFYEYFNADATFLDHAYFLRAKQHLLLALEDFHPDADPRFCTTHDYKVSKMLANTMLRNYFEKKLKELDDIQNSQLPLNTIKESAVHWTASKTDLTELIYALHEAGCINNGKTDIKKLATFFESSFNVELGDYYRTYLDIRYRKTGRTKFLDNLKNKLSYRMDQDDE